MENLALENNTKKISRKIPLAIILILLLAGIFLFVWYYFFYNQDSIAKYITEDVNFYSHWQVKKIFKKNNAQIQTLISENDKLKHILPENLEEKLRNSSEYGLVNFQEQWISIFKPTNNTAFSNVKYKHQGLVFENIQDNQMFLSLLENNRVLSENINYKQNKKQDSSDIIVYIKDPKPLIDEKYFDISQSLPENMFFQISLLENELFAKTKSSIQQTTCTNSIKNTHFSDYKYYINNLSTNNTMLSNIEILANTNNCIDLLVFSDDKWIILFEKSQIDQFQENISEYLAHKYPIEKKRQLPDNTTATHIKADKQAYSWKKEENTWVTGNETEKYYILEENTYFALSNDIQTINSPSEHDLSHTESKCSEYISGNSISINYPEKFIFNNILLTQTNDNTYICIH